MHPRLRGALLLTLGVAACALMVGAFNWLLGADALSTPAFDAPLPEEDVAMNVQTLAKQRLAPEIQSDQWLNGAPVTLQDLRGRVVLIDFWTFD